MSRVQTSDTAIKGPRIGERGHNFTVNRNFRKMLNEKIANDN